MDILVSEKLLDLIMISITFSIILMAIVQKFKTLDFIKAGWQVWIINFCLSFAVGIPFCITFYSLNVIDGIWVSLFGFVGAAGIYEALKQQNIINYTPKSSLVNKKTIPIENEIKRDDL